MILPRGIEEKDLAALHRTGLLGPGDKFDPATTRTRPYKNNLDRKILNDEAGAPKEDEAALHIHHINVSADIVSYEFPAYSC